MVAVACTVPSFLGLRTVSVQAGEPLAAVLWAMAEHQTQRIPVLDGNQFLGVAIHAAAMAATGLHATPVADGSPSPS